MERIVITGANRGLGLEFVRQYAEAGARVFACCRDPGKAQELADLEDQTEGRVTRFRLDVTDPDAIDLLRGELRTTDDGDIDVLINNAGVSPRGERLHNIEAGDMLGVLHVNTVAPLMLIRSLHPCLRHARYPRVVNISSSMGSLIHKDYGRHYSYAASKAALNMVTRAAAHDLADDGIVVVSLHPGWVQTDLGGAEATLSPRESVQGMRKVIRRLGVRDSGSFLTWKGTTHDW